MLVIALAKSIALMTPEKTERTPRFWKFVCTSMCKSMCFFNYFDFSKL